MLEYTSQKCHRDKNGRKKEPTRVYVWISTENLVRAEMMKEAALLSRVIKSLSWFCHHKIFTTPLSLSVRLSLPRKYTETQLCTHASKKSTYSRRPSHSPQCACPWKSPPDGITGRICLSQVLLSRLQAQADTLQSAANTPVSPPLRNNTVGGRNIYFHVSFSKTQRLSYLL